MGHEEWLGGPPVTSNLGENGVLYIAYSRTDWASMREKTALLLSLVKHLIECCKRPPALQMYPCIENVPLHCKYSLALQIFPCIANVPLHWKCSPALHCCIDDDKDNVDLHWLRYFCTANIVMGFIFCICLRQTHKTSNAMLTEVRLRDFRQTCFVICLSDGCRSWSRDRSFERRPAIFVSSVVIIIVKHHHPAFVVPCVSMYNQIYLTHFILS